MAENNNKILSSHRICLIKSRCRKFGIKPDQVDDCLQQLAVKILQSKNMTTLKSEVIDNHIKSQIRKEQRYLNHLHHLTEGFREEVTYDYSLQIDISFLASRMSHLQLEICKLLLDGHTQKQISKKLKISIRRIKQELNVIKQILYTLVK